MLILGSVVLGLTVGLAAGGQMSRLGTRRVAWWWVGLVAFVGQMAAVYAAWTPDAIDIGLIVVSHVALVLVALVNRRLPGARLLATGLAMNLAVMLANGGLMPVAPETLAAAGRVESWKIGAGTPGTRVANSKDVILPVDDTRLELLADRYWTGLPGRLGFIFSLGDVFLAGGVFVFVVATLKSAPGALARKESTYVGRGEPVQIQRVAVPAVWD